MDRTVGFGPADRGSIPRRLVSIQGIEQTENYLNFLSLRTQNEFKDSSQARKFIE